MDLQDQGDPEHGWFERTASGTAISLQAVMLSPSLDSRALFKKAAEGEQEALQLVGKIGRNIGAGIVNIGCLIDPELVIIGGGVSEQLPILLPYIEEALDRYGSQTIRRIPVKAAALGNRAGVLGALKLALH